MKVIGTRVFKENFKSLSPVVVNVGGARSTKSYSIAQLLTSKLMTERNKKFGICRKTMPALKMTAMRLVVDMLKDYGRYRYTKHSLSEHTIEVPHLRNHLQFFSLDNPERIKSAEFNYLWLEEANEFSWEDYIVLSTRMSAPRLDTHVNQMFLSLNPSDSLGWIPKRLISQTDIHTIYSTYKDNPTLSPEYIKMLEGLKDLDKTYYEIYALGKWGTLAGKIYSNFAVAVEWPDQFDEVVYGLDFGFNNPMALVEIGLGDGVTHLRELCYQSGLTTAGLIAIMEDKISPCYRDRVIMADCAEPDRIKEICDAGFNCVGVDKVQNSVNSGIDLCKQQRVLVHPESVNIKMELDTYKWREAKDGTYIDEPLKFNDHAMDAWRYGQSVFRREEGNITKVKGDSASAASAIRNRPQSDVATNPEEETDVPVDETSYASGVEEDSF